MTLATLFTLVVVLLVIGFVVWLIELAPVSATIKRIIQGCVIFFVILWVLLTVIRPLLSKVGG